MLPQFAAGGGTTQCCSDSLQKGAKKMLKAGGRLGKASKRKDVGSRIGFRV